MENHLYHCIYDILSSDISEPPKLPALQRYKAKIVRLHAWRMEKVMLDNNAQDKMEEEEPFLFHILKMVKRRETRVIHQILDKQSNNVTGYRNVLNTFVTSSPEIPTNNNRPNLCYHVTRNPNFNMSNEVCRNA